MMLRLVPAFEAAARMALVFIGYLQNALRRRFLTP
jgi:hypothetical protein